MIGGHWGSVERLKVLNLIFALLFLALLFSNFVMLRVRANPRPFLLASTPMAVGKSGLGFALSQNITKLENESSKNKSAKIRNKNFHPLHRSPMTSNHDPDIVTLFHSTLEHTLDHFLEFWIF